MNDFTHHTAKAAAILLGGRSLPQAVLHLYTALKTEGIEGSERIGSYKRQVLGGNIKNPRKSKEPSPLPHFYLTSTSNADVIRQPSTNEKPLLALHCG